MIRIRKF